MKYYLMVSTYRYVLIIVPVDLVTIFLYLMMSVIKITAHKSLNTDDKIMIIHICELNQTVVHIARHSIIS